MTTSNQYVERYIGQGAYGGVYELKGHKPPAVIKYIACKNDKARQMFKNECEALKAVYHANVVRMLYTEENGGKLGIVMEYCQRGSLRDVSFNPTISYSMNTVLTWGIQLFDAIDHMYQKQKLVHRDIKPDNIFVTNEYQLKIGDFGLVKVVGDGTVTGTFIGTQRYMSPPDMKEDGVQRNVYEQLMQADVLNSHRNDVYSLGLVIWEIIERRTIFKSYEMLGGFDRDRLLFDIIPKRLTEIESPECQSEIQKIILRCTNFQLIHRPTASQVLDFLKQTQSANEFISSLPFMPTEDKKQKELMKPIGFDDRTEWVMVKSEERKYEKRFALDRNAHVENITEIMRDKLGTLNSVEREQFYKEALNIVSRLKEETQTFKDARYVIEKRLEIEREKENLHEKDIDQIFEFFVLGDFGEQFLTENIAFGDLKSHEEIWISSFGNWWGCEDGINSLKEIKRGKYTTNFYFRCFISQLTGEGWIHIEKDQFVSEDFKFWKEIPGKWVDNPRTEIWSYEIENEDKKHELLHFSHYKQMPLERIIETCKKQQKRMENTIKLNLKFLTPIEDSEKNNVPFNIESLLDESSEYERPSKRSKRSTSKSEEESESSDETHPFPHYIFQLRNPPRPICQKNHPGKCQMDGFRKMERWSDLPKEVHIPVCGEITENEVLFLESYLDCIASHGEMTFGLMERPFLFLCCQNLLDIPFLILLDHPNNYENAESIPGLDLKHKLHNIEVGVLREYFQDSKFNKVYALFNKGSSDDLLIRLIDYQGNPKTEWLDLEGVIVKLPIPITYIQFTGQFDKYQPSGNARPRMFDRLELQLQLRSMRIHSKTSTVEIRRPNVQQSKKFPEDDPQNPSSPTDYSSSSLDSSPETPTSSKEEKPEMINVIKTGNSLIEIAQFSERKEIFGREYSKLSIEQKRKFKEKSDRDLKNIKQPTVYSDGLYESLQGKEKPESLEEIYDDMKNLHLRAQLDEFFEAFLLIERVKRTHFEFSLLYQQLAECLERLRSFKDSIYTRRIQFNCYYSTLDKESWLLLKQIDANTCYLTRFIKKDLSTVKYLFGERIDGFSEDASPKLLVNKRFVEHEVKTIRETLQDDEPNLVSVFEKELDEQELVQTEILEKFSDYEELILKNRETVDLLQVIRAVEDAKRAIDSRFDTQSKSKRKAEESLFSNLDFFRLRNPQSPSHQCLNREQCKKIDFPEDLHLCPSKAKLFYYECTPAQEVSLLKRRFAFSQLFNELSEFKSPLRELKVKAEYIQISDLHKKESFLFLTYPLAKASEKEFVVLLDDPFAYAPGERISCFDRRLKFYTIDAKICQDFYKESGLKFMLGIDMNLNAWRINY